MSCYLVQDIRVLPLPYDHPAAGRLVVRHDPGGWRVWFHGYQRHGMRGGADLIYDAESEEEAMAAADRLEHDLLAPRWPGL